MLLEKNLRRLLSHLDYDHVVQIPFGSKDLTLRVFDQASKVILSTPVYSGGNFIPSSVRKCALQKKPFQSQSSIKTFLDIDEGKFLISLSCLSRVEDLNDHNLVKIIEEFNAVAEDWRITLDEHDKNDLVYVRSK